MKLRSHYVVLLCNTYSLTNRIDGGSLYIFFLRLRNQIDFRTINCNIIYTEYNLY